jgi:hypothetical protein
MDSPRKRQLQYVFDHDADRTLSHSGMTERMMDFSPLALAL